MQKATNFDDLKLCNQLCFPLYAAAKEVVRRYKPLLDEIDLTYTQYIAMMVLWEEKKTTVKKLGDRLFLDSGTLTPLLKSLEQKGLIRRTRSTEDERVLFVSLTPEGDRLKERAVDIPKRMASSCMALSPDEGAELYKLLYKILGKPE